VAAADLDFAPRCDPPLYPVLRPGAHRSARYVMLGAMLLPFAVDAKTTFEPFAEVQYEYNSNLFEESGDREALEQRGTEERSDSAVTGVAGFRSGFEWSRQQLQFDAEGRRVEYDRFSSVDHDEHRIAAAYLWRLGSVLDGDIRYTNERRLASFADLDTSLPSLQRERNLEAGANLMVTPKWRVEAGGGRHWLELPLPEYPSFQLVEDKADLALKYVGFASVSAGILVQYVEGEYSGVPDASSFDETTVQFTAEYVRDEQNRVNGSLGYSSRQEDSTGQDTYGLTGSLGYTRAISGKTSFSAELFRRVSSYSAGANSLTETGVSTGLVWRPSGKTRVEGQYLWTRSVFEQDSISGASAQAGRQDYRSSVRLDVGWDARRWLNLALFGEYRDRHSDQPDQGYNANIVGLRVRAQF